MNVTSAAGRSLESNSSKPRRADQRPGSSNAPEAGGSGAADGAGTPTTETVDLSTGGLEWGHKSASDSAWVPASREASVFQPRFGRAEARPAATTER